MSPIIRICQLFELKMQGQPPSRGQNFYIGENLTYKGRRYSFVPFETTGTTQSLGGDNPQVSLLMPNEEFILHLLEGGDGNRNSELTLTHIWVTPAGSLLPGPLVEFYVGIGAGDSDTTIELRFRSALDSVGSRFPYRVLTAENVGILPLNSEISLR
jgi:hypothetical protein